jgi:hypothetical protein
MTVTAIELAQMTDKNDDDEKVFVSVIELYICASSIVEAEQFARDMITGKELMTRNWRMRETHERFP